MVAKTARDERYGEGIVRQTVTGSRFNRLAYLDGSLVSEEPIVGFADAYDPLIAEFKGAVDRRHLSPMEAWQEAFPGAAKPKSLSIIAWTLPFSKAIRKSNRGPQLPSLDPREVAYRGRQQRCARHTGGQVV